MDISPHGCRLRVGEDLGTGAKVTVLFEAPLRDGAQAAAMEVPGSVQWSRLEGLSHQAGVPFAACPDGLTDILAALQEGPARPFTSVRTTRPPPRERLGPPVARPD